MSNVIPVIMAGGSGTRLWPLSRESYPKQFLKLNGEFSLLQETVLRLPVTYTKDVIVLTNEEYRFVVAEQLREIGIKNCQIVLEPVSKNTAPAIALASLIATEGQKLKNSNLLILSSDHAISNNENFQEAINRALEASNRDKLVTFGIVPTHPETGYGYIKKGAELLNSVNTVDSFEEKPTKSRAKELLQNGDYVWNSGMFMFKPEIFLTELENFAPEVHKACLRSYQSSVVDNDFIRPDKNLFETSPSISIDYAVMEKTSLAAVISADLGWNDIGGYSALWDIADKDSSGNVVNGDVLSINTSDTFISSNSRLVSTLGVKDLVVVETKDAVLVAHKSQAQNVKEIVNELKEKNRSEYKLNREVYRPWGKYDSIDNGDRFQVKRITVKPGAKLSVQMHHHRAEHWIVVSGTAKVTNGNEIFLLSENQSTYIPAGEVHALENPGVIPLELIEVQSGSYLGEDDIVRFEDKYGRA